MSVIYGTKYKKKSYIIVEGHSEGTVSQIFYLGPRFYFMISRKLSCKEIVKSFPFLT